MARAQADATLRRDGGWHEESLRLLLAVVVLLVPPQSRRARSHSPITFKTTFAFMSQH